MIDLLVAVETDIALEALTVVPTFWVNDTVAAIEASFIGAGRRS